MDVSTAQRGWPLQLETKFVRLKTPVTVGSYVGEWRVT
jgi:hypothetical protein